MKRKKRYYDYFTNISVVAFEEMIYCWQEYIKRNWIRNYGSPISNQSFCEQSRQFIFKSLFGQVGEENAETGKAEQCQRRFKNLFSERSNVNTTKPLHIRIPSAQKSAEANLKGRSTFRALRPPNWEKCLWLPYELLFGRFRTIGTNES